MEGNMKSKISLVIIIAVVITAAAILFAACNNAGEKENDATQVPEATETVIAPTDAPTQAPTEVPTEAPTPTPAPTIKKGTNVALNADVEVSSTTGLSHIQWGWSYEYINDGLIIDNDEPSLGWTTNVGVNFEADHEEWVLFTLAKVTNIDSVKIFPTLGGSYCPVSFEIQVSMDGENFTTVAKVEDNTRAATGDETPFLLEFEAVNAKYVRFLATKLYDMLSSLGDGILCQLAEIEIYAA